MSNRNHIQNSRDNRVLVLAPSGNDGEVTTSLLVAENGIGSAEACETMVDLCNAIRTGAGTAVITDEVLTPEALGTLAQTIAAQPPWSDFPLIILASGGSGTYESRLALLELGSFTNATVLERPLRIATLISSVKVALRSRTRQYELRDYLQEREQMELRQRTLLRDMLASVTEGKLRLCESANELPDRFPAFGNGETIFLTQQTLRVLRRRAMEAGQAVGMDKTRGNDLITAVSETGMNAVVHAGGGIATVGVDTEKKSVQVWVEDQGNGIDMSRLPQATLDRGYTTAGTLGHGFKMVLSMVDTVWLLTSPHGTTVVLAQEQENPKPGWLGEV